MLNMNNLDSLSLVYFSDLVYLSNNNKLEIQPFNSPEFDFENSLVRYYNSAAMLAIVFYFKNQYKNDITLSHLLNIAEIHRQSEKDYDLNISSISTEHLYSLISNKLKISISLYQFDESSGNISKTKYFYNKHSNVSIHIFKHVHTGLLLKKINTIIGPYCQIYPANTELLNIKNNVKKSLLREISNKMSTTNDNDILDLAITLHNNTLHSEFIDMLNLLKADIPLQRATNLKLSRILGELHYLTQKGKQVQKYDYDIVFLFSSKEFDKDCVMYANQIIHQMKLLLSKPSLPLDCDNIRYLIWDLNILLCTDLDKSIDIFANDIRLLLSFINL